MYMYIICAYVLYYGMLLLLSHATIDIVVQLFFDTYLVSSAVCGVHDVEVLVPRFDGYDVR